MPSLSCRSAPRPLPQRRRRIGAPGEPAFTSPAGDDSGSGSRNSSLSQEVTMNRSESNFFPCSIEVSSQTLLVARGSQAPRAFPNTSTGHQAVLRFLEQAGGRVRVCMEATGRYGLDLALTLHGAGLAVMVANPRAVRHFAIADMRRSKTDRVDAAVL